MNLRILSVISLIAASLAASTIAQENGDLAEFRRLHDELRVQMSDNLDQAVVFLESKIKAKPDSEDLNVLRQSLASRLAAEGKFQSANEQLEKLLDFQLQHSQQVRNQYGAWMTIQSMREVSRESGNTDALDRSIDHAFSKLAEADADLMPRSQLAVLKARNLADDDQSDAAKTLVADFLTKLQQASESNEATDQNMLAYVGMLRSLTSDDADNDLWLDDSIKQIDLATTEAIKRFPKSLALQSSYAETALLKITRWNQDDPDATNKNIDTALAALEPFIDGNAVVRAMAKRIELYKTQIASAKPKESLIGKPAPPWDIDRWVNTIAMQRDDLKGKVVMLDFWAMWCGPCIATFPHLRQWREEFGDQDFEIVGVTTYYNFDWDEEKNRAKRSTDDVPSDQECQTIAAFLEHHQLKHPVIVTPEDSKMSSQYGVRGIPHVVLIDKKGIVQLVKTGAGEATAKEIHAKIKALLDQPN